MSNIVGKKVAEKWVSDFLKDEYDAITESIARSIAEDYMERSAKFAEFVHKTINNITELNELNTIGHKGAKYQFPSLKLLNRTFLSYYVGTQTGIIHKWGQTIAEAIEKMQGNSDE